MAFTSFQFIVFFIIVYLLDWILMRSKQKTIEKYKTLLLIESICFVVIADWKTAISIMVLTIICQYIAIVMEKHNDNINIKRGVLVIALVFSIGQLVYFKYYDFLAESILGLLGKEYTAVNTYAPIGVSFFTFSAIAYLVDIYRNKYSAYEKGRDLALYLFYFPKLVSGPIVRPDKFYVQLKDGCNKMNLQNLQSGIQLVVWGLFKKMVLADHLAVFVDDVFKAPALFDSATCIWAILSYTLQIYFDFAGYSDMAIGFSKMLGIEIENNFNLPYISKNITEFWKRWHISLSSWLQEYVYISLGGNRKGKIRTQINLILTMLIGGLWHGASWTFVIWGGIHGIALVVQKKFHNICKNISWMNCWVARSVSIVITFIYVNFTWVFFRADSIDKALEILGQACGLHKGISHIYTWTWLAIFFMISEIILAKIWQQKETNIEIKYPIMELNSVKNLVLFFILIGLTIILAYVGETAFIYGQF